MKKFLWQLISKSYLGDLLRPLGSLLRHREMILGFRNPLHMKFITTKQGGNLYVSEFESHISLGSASEKLIRFDPNQFEDDVSLIEFADEIDDWVIETLQNIGCDSARSVLDINREDLIKRTDLEQETVDNVLKILESEFEE